MTNERLITIASSFSVSETIERLPEAARLKGLHVFARIDHGANAKDAGFALRPTELIIFGNPKGGTPLMLESQTARIDLPVKASAWEDAAGQVWLTYNHARWLARRHKMTARSKTTIAAIEAGFDMLYRMPTQATP
jgi:uncharacterized protein (DUF302 family)